MRLPGTSGQLMHCMCTLHASQCQHVWCKALADSSSAAVVRQSSSLIKQVGQYGTLQPTHQVSRQQSTRHSAGQCELSRLDRRYSKAQLQCSWVDLKGNGDDHSTLTSRPSTDLKNQEELLLLYPCLFVCLLPVNQSAALSVSGEV